MAERLSANLFVGVNNMVPDKLARVLKAAVELVCAPSWFCGSDEAAELERVLRECGYVQGNDNAVRLNSGPAKEKLPDDKAVAHAFERIYAIDWRDPSYKTEREFFAAGWDACDDGKGEERPDVCNAVTKIGGDPAKDGKPDSEGASHDSAIEAIEYIARKKEGGWYPLQCIHCKSAWWGDPKVGQDMRCPVCAAGKRPGSVVDQFPEIAPALARANAPEVGND